MVRFELYSKKKNGIGTIYVDILNGNENEYHRIISNK